MVLVLHGRLPFCTYDVNSRHATSCTSFSTPQKYCGSVLVWCRRVPMCCGCNNAKNAVESVTSLTSAWMRDSCERPFSPTTKSVVLLPCSLVLIIIFLMARVTKELTPLQRQRQTTNATSKKTVTLSCTYCSDSVGSRRHSNYQELHRYHSHFTCYYDTLKYYNIVDSDTDTSEIERPHCSLAGSDHNSPAPPGIQRSGMTSCFSPSPDTVPSSKS